MAYTKAPVTDTHNVTRIPALGSPIVVSDDSVDVPTTLNYIDCFPKQEPQYGTKPITRVHKRDAWISADVTDGSGFTASSFSKSVVITEEANPSVFFAYGTTFYRVAYASPSSATVAALATTSSGASFATGTLAVDNSNVNKVCFLALGGDLRTWNEDGTGGTVTNLQSSFSIGATGFRNLVFLNGYLFAATNNAIYNSNAGGVLTTWTNTDFIGAELFPDGISWIDKHHNYLVAFGKESIEFFYDGAVEIGSPLVRQESYASRIGLKGPALVGGGCVAAIEDDLYFIGRNQSNSYSFYRLRNFKIEEIVNDYIIGLLNPATGAAEASVQVIIQNHEPQVMISLYGSDGPSPVYHPKEDTWWMVSRVGDASPLNTDLPGQFDFISCYNLPGYGTQILCRNDDDDSLDTRRPDIPGSISIESVVYSEVVDLGTNFIKHLARIDAIGDYGLNTLTLAYNGSPKYSTTYTNCTPTRTPSTLGYGNNLSWYNLGGYRRFSFKLTMDGVGPGYHEALDMEYNFGAT